MLVPRVCCAALKASCGGGFGGERESLHNGPKGEKTLGIRLFGFKYADELQELTSDGSSISMVVEEIVKKAQPLGKSEKGDYATEVKKGLKLAKCVSLKEKDLWFWSPRLVSPKGAAMKRWIGTALAVLAVAGFGSSTAAQALDRMNAQQYGNCHVSTVIDALTDKEGHSLTCSPSDPGSLTDLLNPVGIGLLWVDGQPAVVFAAGLTFHLESHTDVAWRIDKGEVRRGNWLSSDAGGANTMDRDVFDTLLAELPAAKRIVIHVGNEQAIISLNGSAAAVKDFRSRIRFTKPLAQPVSPQHYRVQRGDTLGQIAKGCNTTVGALVSLNNLKPPYLIQVGDILRIPLSDQAQPCISAN